MSRENNELMEDIKELKADFNAFKLRYEDIYSKEILEIFNLDDLWQETFRQDLLDADRLVIATDKFKPEDIIVGQVFIASKSKEKAIEWLKIIKTALIFVDDNAEDLKKESSVKEVENTQEDYDISNTFENFWD